MSTELPPNSPAADEQQLCIRCMAPNALVANFCTQCGAPLSSYANTGPFERLFAEGSSYRQAVERPQKFIVVLGIWLIFGTMTIGGIFLAIMGSSSIYLLDRFSDPLVSATMIILSVTMIWKTTRNYIKQKNAPVSPDA